MSRRQSPNRPLAAPQPPRSPVRLSGATGRETMRAIAVYDRRVRDRGLGREADMNFVLMEVRQPARKPLVVAVRESLEIGRDCDGLLLIDPETSRRHVVVRCDGDVVTVTDLGSTNGTTV